MTYYKFMAPLAILAVGCGGAGSEEATASQSENLLAAPIDPGDSFSAALCSYPLNTDPDAGPLNTCVPQLARGLLPCSATLIARNLVLTARHCVSIPKPDGSFGPTGDASLFHVTFSSSAVVGTPVWHSVSQVLVPDAAEFGQDLALLILSERVRLDEARPIDVDLRTNLAGPHHPDEFTIVGRGMVNAEIGPSSLVNVDFGDFQKRVLQHIPFVCASDDLTAQPCSLPPPGSTNYFSIGPSALFGDSGAGVLSQGSYVHHRPVVEGVVSEGSFGPDGKTANTFPIRVGNFASFLRAGAATAAEAGSYRAPEWASQHPGSEHSDEEER
jgi:hypothetical protein